MRSKYPPLLTKSFCMSTTIKADLVMSGPSTDIAFRLPYLELWRPISPGPGEVSIVRAPNRRDKCIDPATDRDLPTDRDPATDRDQASDTDCAASLPTRGVTAPQECP